MPAATHAIVERRSGEIVSRHAGLNAARAAWRHRGTAPSPGGYTVTPWAAAHMILPLKVATEARARRAGARAIRITPVSHPNVHHAFDLIATDAGEPARSQRNVPRRYEEILDQAEAALAELDANGFETACLGATGAVRALVEEQPALQAAADLMRAYYEGWPAPRRRTPKAREISAPN